MITCHSISIGPEILALFPESQTKQFQDFLTRANRYPSLMMGGAYASGGGVSNQRSRKIVLVEVILFYLEHTLHAFFSLVRHYSGMISPISIIHIILSCIVLLEFYKQYLCFFSFLRSFPMHFFVIPPSSTKSWRKYIRL